jgi:signal transduction histidine kinase
MDTPLGANLGRWRLGLLATAGDPFNETSQQRQAVHVWIAILVVAVTCVLAWLLAGILRRRLRLAQLKNDLVATVSHELKTPLASIRLLVDTLLEADGKPADKNSPVQVREYLQLIAQENARLTRLIDNFLTFSRMERGMQNFDFQVIDLQEVNSQAAAVFREHWPDADSCLQIEEGPQAFVLGDLDSLVTAVGNLLENAWKYSDEQKQIVLSASSNGERATIAVRDNGIGLPPRAASHVFDRFFQVDQRVARTQGGCGLGLSIVQAIIQAHGGEAQVESQLGVGSTFTLCMPKHSADNASFQSQVEQEANR